MGFFNKDRQSDALQLHQDAKQSTTGGYRNFQRNRQADNRPLTPSELEQIRIAHLTRRLRK